MSWHCSQALVEDFSELGCLDGDQCAELKSIRTAGRSSFAGKRKATWKPFPCGMMSAPLTAYRGVVSWMSSLLDSRANHSANREDSEDMKTLGTCGRKRSDSFAKYNRCSHSWRTSHTSHDMPTFKGSWGTYARSGLMLDGRLYPLENLERPTLGADSGFSHPTPNALAWKGASDNCNRRYNDRIHVWLHEQFSLNQKTTYPAPECLERVMAWPLTWTGLEPLETDRFREWLQQHGSC